MTVRAGQVPVTVRDATGVTRDVLLPGDTPLAVVLGELGVPAAGALDHAVTRLGDNGVGANGLGASVTDGTGTADVLRGSVADHVVAGAVLSAATVPPRPHAPGDGAAAACDAAQAVAGLDLAVVAGLDSGSMRRLAAGVHRLPSGALLAVTAGTTQPRTWAEAGAETETIPVGASLEVAAQADAGSALPLAASVQALSVLALSVLAVSPPITTEPSRTEAFRRPPRPADAGGVAALEPPDLPPPPAAPTPLSWASLLAPIPIALAMAVFFRPLFALFGLMGPVLVLGRWFEQRRSRRKQARLRDAAIHAARHQIEDLRQAQRAARARDAWTRAPHVAHLRERARTRSVRIWERRGDDLDRLQVMIGVGQKAVAPLWATPPPDELRDRAAAPLRLRPVPHCVDLLGHGGLGTFGDLAAGRAVIRSLVLQLATLRGPADLAVVVVASDLAVWDWVKWLPHTDQALVAEPVNPTSWERHEGRGVILVVDDPHADVASMVRLATDAGVELSVLSMAESSGELPAACSTVIGVEAAGWIVEVNQSDASDDLVASSGPLAVGLAEKTAVEWARSLARIHDPERAIDPTIQDLAAPSLPQTLELDGAASVARAHGSLPAGLPFVLGIESAGLAAFDLAVDGPHALVAGTTGSGKSELLRTLVLSLAAALPPERLAFVLVDFKGGGAFDGCAGLPHVAGLITDLDEGLVRRALAGLRAEVRSREETVRRGETLTPLVVVIDEFAVLAHDYPDVLDGLIDLAARGRSLAMHLILATQKPSGVVDHRIRANTNLRIALRVQHAHESHDVVGVATAAELDRRHPGRAIVRVGSDDVRTMQVCSTESSAASANVGPIIEPFTLSPTTSPVRSEVTAEEAPLELLARWIAEAAGAASARPVWTPPLAARCSFVELRSLDDDMSPGYPLGIADDPDERRQQVYRWSPTAGSLVVFSGDPAPADHLIASLLGDVVRGDGPVELAYVISGPSVEMAATWEAHSCVGSVIAPTDHERLERLLALLETQDEGGSSQVHCPPTLLAVADIGSLLASFDDLARLELVERIEHLARTGPARGVFLVFGARSVRDLPHRIAQHVPHRLLGSVADPTAHLVLGVAAPANAEPMHVVDAATGHVVLLGDGPEPDTLRSANRSLAPVIARCPALVEARELTRPVVTDSGLDLEIGVRYVDLDRAVLPLRWGRDLLVAGPAGSGRTSTLALIGQLAEQAGVDVSTISGRGELAFPRADLDALSGIVLVDDADRLADDVVRVLSELIRQPNRSITLIVASTIDGARAPRTLAAAVRANGSGILVGGSPLDGEIFRIRRPELPGLGRIPGRATLVSSGRAQSVQLAIAGHTA